MKIKILRGLVFLLLIFLVINLQAYNCFAGKNTIIASIFPVADMVKQVGGIYVDVTTVIPSGASPHTYEPKPSLLEKIAKARVFFMIGAGLELWAEKFLSLSNSQIVTVRLSEGIPLIKLSKHVHSSDCDYNHDNIATSIANPHIWLDLEIAKLMVSKIISVLCKIDNKHIKYYEKRGLEYLDQIDQLHILIASTVKKFKTRKYVSFHPAWDYFARRYGLESVGVIETIPGKSPTPQKIKKIISLIIKHDIRAVLAESKLNPKVAEVIAMEAKVKVLLLDPIGDPTIKDRSSYIDLIKYNLKVFQEAML